jgi:hypothetical protein
MTPFDEIKRNASGVREWGFGEMLFKKGRV